MARYTLALAALIAIARAITITSPSTDGEWDLSKGAQTITWTSVSSDPKVVDIYLVHMTADPPLSDKIFSKVDISKGSEDVSGLQLPTGSDYQINFVSPDKPEQILAQSPKFTVNGVAARASSTLPGFTGSSTSTVPSTSTSTDASSSNGTALVTSASASKTAAAKSTTSHNGAAATGIPVVGLLAGAAALFL